jgi:hypothetical protein
MPTGQGTTNLLSALTGLAGGYMEGLQKRHAEKRQDQQLETQRAFEDWNSLTPESQGELTKQGLSWRDPQYWKKKGDVAAKMAQGTPAQAIAGLSPIQPKSGTGDYFPKIGAPAATGITAPGPTAAAPMANPGIEAKPGKTLETYDSLKIKNDQSKLVEQANAFAERAAEADRRAADVEKNTDVKLQIAGMGYQVQYDKLSQTITNQTNEYNVNLGKLNEQIKKDGQANTILLQKIQQQGKAIDSLNKYRDKVQTIAKQKVGIAQQNANSAATRAGASVTNANANKERADKYKSGGGGGSRSTGAGKPMSNARRNTLVEHLHGPNADHYQSEWDLDKQELGLNGLDDNGKKLKGGVVKPVDPYHTPGAKVVKAGTNKVVTKIKHPASWWRQQGKAAGLTGKPLEDYVNTYAK